MGYYAFTTKNNGIVRQLLNDVEIIYGNNSTTEKALWDTGATASCISSEVAKNLGMIPTGRRAIATPSGRTTVNTYEIDIVLPNNVRIAGVPVSDSSIGSQGLGMLIGMDIISMGDFAVTTAGGKTIFSYVMPSIGAIDFLPKAKALNQVQKGHMKKRK